ncbi:MAG: hypothetical protein P8X91_00385 [Candidatus Bathyarchaeota archaeon]
MRARMDRFQRLAHEIIDYVEYSIRTANPEVDNIASSLVGNT